MTVLFGLLFRNSMRAEEMTITFPVLGNCYLCKIRIEAAVNELPGIDTVNWNYVSKVTTVTFNDEEVDAYMMMHAIAHVGHDTEWFPASDSAYQTLVGTCCEYERTNDYTNVQVGYLSLMDLWVFPVGIDEPSENAKLRVYPTAGTGIFHFELSSKISPSGGKISLYSMNGARVYEENLSGKTEGRIALEFLGEGQYILVITDNKRILARSKLIKL